MEYLLEAPVFNIQSALDAARFGVHRLELCANFPEGGETPSAGMLQTLKSELDIPVFVMIRPRGGDFCYSPKELLVMKKDIEILGEMGADGFVFGVLDADGNIHSEACESLLRAASGKPCTFHRAFDVCRSPEESLEEIIRLGFRRILTSGAKNSVTEGIAFIEKLIQKAAGRIIIMPGGGSKPDHVLQLKKWEGFQEIHASCKTKVRSINQYFNPEVQFSTNSEDFKFHLGIDQIIVEEFLEAFKE
ncbi:copper homeostasis protein CutC [Algoriphagus kandeliae]|uniref:PF03932 family protein CutC n=1 Tax=Algoriphagus kandeliae TaxID=2562278 RepID=A0A4Y9QTU7_9BACT|nr:copper homeostasis protein CutC [Algoriphagus kandeliae]TFV94643.1 copper homeostasis protein CutC [Algoriphagus kandeliae]